MSEHDLVVAALMGFAITLAAITVLLVLLNR